MNKRILSTIIVFIIGMLSVGGILYVTTKVVYRDRKIESDIEALKQQEQNINNENRKLQDMIAFQQTPQAQELFAKQKLDRQNQDENVAIIKPGISTQSGAAPQTTQSDPDVRQQSNYQKWWNYFFAYNQ